MTRHAETSKTMSDIAQAWRLLAPTVLGLMCARLGLIVATYGSYASTDAGVFTDGSSLAAMAPIVILMLYLGATRKRLPKKAVFILTAAAIAIQSTATILLGVLILLPGTWRFFELVLSTIITLASWIAIFYWLRRARGTSSSAAAAIAFGSLLLSEPIIYVASLLPRGMACIAVGLAASLQFFFQKKARLKPLPEKAHADKMPIGYFGFAKRTQDGVHVLGVLAFGMFVLSIAVGALRGFPNGQAVPFQPATRIGYMLVVMTFFAVLIWQSFRGSRSIMSTTIWLMLEMFGIFAVAAYAAFPDAPDIGAMFTTVFNAGMTGFMWYLVIAFSSFGKRDPYYYAAAGWTVYILPRALARSGIVAIAPTPRATPCKRPSWPGSSWQAPKWYSSNWSGWTIAKKTAPTAARRKAYRRFSASTTSMTFPTTPRASAAPLCRTTHGSSRNSSCFPTVKPKCLRCTRSA